MSWIQIRYKKRQESLTNPTNLLKKSLPLCSKTDAVFKNLRFFKPNQTTKNTDRLDPVPHNDTGTSTEH